MNHVPDFWPALILALGAFRLWRLLSSDTILDKPRHWLLVNAKKKAPRKYGKEVETFLKCPFCLGWWVSLVTWGAWLIWPNGTLIAMTPFMLSAVVGLIKVNLDL